MKIPATAPAEIQQAFREVWTALSRWEGSQNIDLSGRRIINANSGVDSFDYVTRYDVETLIASLKAEVAASNVAFTGLVPGAVLFAKSTTAVGQNAPNFFWNDVLKCLGIGTKLPTSPLHIALAGAGGLRVDCYGSTALFKAYGSGGTLASPGATGSGQSFAGIWAYGHTGSAWATGPNGWIEFVAAEAFGASARGTYFEIALTKATTTACYRVARFTGAGMLLLTPVVAAANTRMTTGLTVDQDTATNEALALQASGSVAHGMTSIWNTTTWFAINRVNTEGGVCLNGIDGTNPTAMQAKSAVGVEDATRSTSGVGPFVFDTFLKNGTGLTALSADKNMVVFRNAGTARAIIDSDGDIHLDGTSNNNVWDAYDDVELLTAYRALTGPVNMRARFGDVLAQHRDVLVRTGVMSEGGFVSMKGLSALMIDAIRQLAQQQRSAA